MRAGVVLFLFLFLFLFRDLLITRLYRESRAVNLQLAVVATTSCWPTAIGTAGQPRQWRQRFNILRLLLRHEPSHPLDERPGCATMNIVTDDNDTVCPSYFVFLRRLFCGDQHDPLRVTLCLHTTALAAQRRASRRSSRLLARAGAGGPAA